MNGIKVLSLFDGISCGRIALERAGIPVEAYYASEIKKIAIETTMLHYPDTVQIGDVTKVRYENGTLYTESGEHHVGKIDLLIGGSPCQDFSNMKALNGDGHKGLKGTKSRLFYEYLRLLNEVKPRFFLLENVKMKKDSERLLNEYLGVNGISINSKLVSYQNRPRVYWTNIPNVIPPEDRHIDFQNYREREYNKELPYRVNRTPSRERMWNNGQGRNQKGACPNVTNSPYIYCITRKQDRHPNSGFVEFDGFCRFLTRRELELGQTLPLGYTDNLTYTQMQDVVGDGWTVDVIAHIFSFAKPYFPQTRSQWLDELLEGDE